MATTQWTNHAALAAERNLVAALTEWATAADGGGIESRDGAFLARCASPMRSFNNVVVERRPDDLADLVEYARAFFSGSGSRFRLRVRDDVAPIDDAPFVAAGLTPLGGIPCLAVDPRAVERLAPSAGLSIRAVEDASTLDDHLRVIAQAFDFDGANLARALTPRLLNHSAWRGYVGYEGATPVATSQLVVCGRTSGIYYVATVESARGRGFGGAMTARATSDAAANGCDTTSLQSSPMGLRIYERLGFRRIAHYRTYVPA